MEGTADRSPPSPGGRHRTRWRLPLAALVLVVGGGGLAIDAVHGARVVDAQRHGTALAEARLDDAFYSCLATQARSLVAPGEPARIAVGPVAGVTESLSDYVTLMKAVGAWLAFAPLGAHGVPLLAVDHHRGPGTCLGYRVVAVETVAGGRTVLRRGTGASLAGDEPPPSLPL